MLSIVAANNTIWFFHLNLFNYWNILVLFYHSSNIRLEKINLYNVISVFAHYWIVYLYCKNICFNFLFPINVLICFGICSTYQNKLSKYITFIANTKLFNGLYLFILIKIYYVNPIFFLGMRLMMTYKHH